MSIKKVAEMAGVSIATVSRYLNNPDMVKPQTLNRVEDAINALNYQPNTLAQNFRRGKSGLIVVVVYNIGDPLYEHFTRTVTQSAKLKNYDVLIKEAGPRNTPLKIYQDMLNSKQVDGMIVMVDLPNSADELTTTLQNLPIVYIKGETLDNRHDQCIGIDNYQAARTAMEHLLDLGHQNIACLSPSGKNIAHHHRRMGCTRFLEEQNLDASRIFSITKDEHSLEKALDDILHQPSQAITAIFCTDDDIAIDVLPLLRERKVQVPQDMSIIGFNNIRYASKTFPPLTTIELPLHAVAQHAFEILYNILESDKPSHPAKRILFSHQLIIRSSTMTAKK